VKTSLNRRLLVLLPLLLTSPALAVPGARSFKSGPIQVTADGSAVWVANPDHDSVSRLAVPGNGVTEFPLPQPAPPALPERQEPRGIAVREDGSEIWVACHASDRVYVLAADGSVIQRIDLPWGSGPMSVALSRDQRTALVACTRSKHVAVVDAQAHRVTALLDCFRNPFGIAFLDDGVSAWLTHQRVYERLTRVSRIELTPTPRVTTQERTDGSGPQDDASLRDPDPTHDIAEGGYLTFRGHLAQKPSAAGGARVFVPTQYGNRNQTVITPNGIIQGVVRQIDLTTRRLPNTITDKIIFTAKQVHDPATNAWLGPGWDAPISGPVDIAFSADGSVAYLLNEVSDNVLVFRTNTPPENLTNAPPLPTVDVGFRPQGIAASPVTLAGRDLVYVANILSRTVSVVDVTNPDAPFELAQVDVTPTTPEPMPADFRNGEHLFHTSKDPRISINSKVSCASCHVGGEDDGRAWEIQFLPGNHGPRQTQSLLGLSLSFGPIDPTTGLGQLHRSGDRDEVQDFDHTFRGQQMGGTGFISSGLQPPLGAGPNAGLDADLDDIATYLLQLPPRMRSPYRAADGSLTEAARRGAAMFVGSGALPADANCASCHVPETGFVDQRFHDVGQRHDMGEAELNVRPPTWGVNTATLVGIWDTPPYVGVAQPKDAESLLEALLDFRNPARTQPHGRLAGMTLRQLQDLVAFLGSIDGSLTAAEVRAAQDVDPPRVVRVEAASLTRIDAWFSESVAASAANPAAWHLVPVAGGPPVAILAGVHDGVNGDRITLTTAPMPHDCGPVDYRLVPLGPIMDIADTANNGVANALDIADPANARTFTIGDTLTVTFGRSGNETFQIPVHDAGTIYGNPTVANGSVWVRGNAGGTILNQDFLRFEWEAAFSAATGVASPADILDARITLQPFFGDSQSIEVRRVLQAWWDHHQPDQTRTLVDPVSGHGCPTYRDSEYNVKAWNMANGVARAPGVDGQNPSDYLGSEDTANMPDVVLAMTSIQDRAVISGNGVTDAFRFWFSNPSLDFGYAFQLVAGSLQETKFRSGEDEIGQFGPVLSITYRLPPTSSPTPPEVSAAPSGVPLMVTPVSASASLDLSFEDVGALASAYAVYEGGIGTWYSHSGVACSILPPASGGRRVQRVLPAVGNRYFVVTAIAPCAEGTSGADSFGMQHPAANLDCAP
jgi:DNA-binding beta-propeller fold protein YncE